MPKYIKEFKIDRSKITSSGAIKKFTITGDVGAVFSMHIKRGNGNYFNFKTNVFTSTFTSENTMKNVKLSGSTYSISVPLPSNASGDTYTFQLFPQPHFDTELINTLQTEYIIENQGADTRETKVVFNKYYYEVSITQNADTVLTFTLASKAHSSKYSSFGSDAVDVEITGSQGSRALSTTSLSWKVTATDADDSCGFTVVRQPINVDWEVSKTTSLGGTAYKVKGLRTAEKIITLDTVEGLNLGDTITNNYSGSDIPEIIYINEDTNEVEVDVVQTLANDVALTLTGTGTQGIDSHTSSIVDFQNLKVQTADEYDGFNIKTSASKSGTGAIAIDDTLGLVLGLKVTGVDLGEEGTITAINRSGNTVTLGGASHVLKDNAILKVTGGANEATITCDILVTKFPQESSNVTLNLDSILLPVGTV